MASPLAKLVESFTVNPMVSGKVMRQLLEQDSRQFLQDSLPLLQAAPDVPGFYHLLALLQSHDLILKNICDPGMFTTQQAIALAKRLARIEPHFEIKLAKALLAPKARATKREIERNAQSPAGRRLLEIIAAISEGTQSLLVAQLLEHPDAHVRSKAALLVGKSNKNANWTQQRLLETDGRVRANVLEALWGAESDECRGIFWSALADRDNRVVGNAILGLHRLGDPATIGLILEMTGRPEPDFQKTAVWVMGESGDLRFLPWLEDVLASPSAALRTHAFHALMKLKKKRARLAALPALGVQFLPRWDARDGWTEVHLSVVREGYLALVGLKPTQFVLWENGHQIIDFNATGFAEALPLLAGFALPHLVGAMEKQAAYRQAFASCLRLKRNEDAWMMLKYSWNNSEAPSLQPANSELLIDAEAVEEFAGSSKTHAKPAGNLWQAAAILVRAPAPNKCARHVVLMDDGSAAVPSPDVIEKLGNQAKAASVAIDAISSREGVFEQLCRQNRGRCFHCPNEESLSKVLNDLYGCLIANYQLRYRTSGGRDAEPAELKVQVSAEAGLGAATTTLS